LASQHADTLLKEINFQQKDSSTSLKESMPSSPSGKFGSPSGVVDSQSDDFLSFSGGILAKRVALLTLSRKLYSFSIMRYSPEPFLKEDRPLLKLPEREAVEGSGVLNLISFPLAKSNLLTDF